MIDALIEKLQTGTAEEKEQAAKQLRKDFSADSVQPLIKVLNEQYEGIRRSSIKTLGIIGDARAFDPIAQLVGDPDTTVRQTIPTALVALNPTKAIKYLRILISDESSNVRHSVIKALRTLPESNSQVAELLLIASQDDNPTIRRSTAECLGAFEEIELLKELLSDEMVQDDPDKQVLRLVTSELAKIGNERSAEILLSAIAGADEPDALNFILEGLRKTLRSIDAEQFRVSSRERGILALRPILIRDNEPELQRMALAVLGEYVGGTGTVGSTLDLIADSLHSLNREVRSEAIKTFGRSGDKRTIPLLSELLSENTDVNNRRMAVRALGWIRNPDAISALGQALEDEDQSIRIELAEALQMMNDSKTIPYLAVLLRDESFKVRSSAVRALSQIGGVEAFVALADILLEDPHRVYKTLYYWHDGFSGKAKADYLIRQVFTKASSLDLQQFNPSLIFKAMLPSPTNKDEEEIQRDQDNLLDQILDSATNNNENPSLMSILADLLSYGVGGRDRAAEYIEAYEQKHLTPPVTLSLFRKYVGGERALEPILATLKSNLDEYFLEPINDLNATTIKMWGETVDQAKRGFQVRLAMSIAVFVLGFSVSILALHQFTFGSLEHAEAYIGPGVSLATGLASMIATFYYGPVKEIKASVIELGLIHTAFIGYVHIVLEVSQTFATLVLQGKIDFSEMERSNDLIKTAMTHTHDLLSPKAQMKEGGRRT